MFNHLSTHDLIRIKGNEWVIDDEDVTPISVWLLGRILVENKVFLIKNYRKCMLI